MSELTTFITATAVLTAISATKGQPAVIVPFYKADLYDERGTVKRLFVNYSFGSWDRVRERIKYKSSLGQVKERLFTSIVGSKAIALYCDGKTMEQIKAQILDVMWATSGDSKILFVFDKRVADDEPFFEAIGIKQRGQMVKGLSPPLSLADVGLTVQPPFVAISPDELRGTLEKNTEIYDLSEGDRTHG